MNTEVYSWRVSTELKKALEREARRRKISLTKALDLAAEEWRKKGGTDKDDAVEQRRLHATAAKTFGTIEGHPDGAENAREIVRQRIRQRHGRSRPR
jgi:hypothetical protein